MKTPLISVVVSFYNCERYLDECLTSTLNQSFSDFEVILINDCSTDNSDAVVQKYLHDKRIVYIINDTRKYLSLNLNYGISIARGKFIARLDGDDYNPLDRFAKQIDFLDTHPDIDIVSGYLQVIDEDWNFKNIITKPTDPEIIKSKIFYYLTIAHCCSMIRKKVYDHIWLYRAKYNYWEDVDRTFRALYSGHKAANLPEVVYFYRKHSSSVNTNHKIIAKISLELKKNNIKELGIKVSPFEWTTFYGHYVFGMLFKGSTQDKIFHYTKKIFRI